MTGERLDTLRRIVARIEAPAVSLTEAAVAPVGILCIDQALGGGLARGALHEVAARSEPHSAVATAAALGIAAMTLSRRDRAESCASRVDVFEDRHRIANVAPEQTNKNIVWIAEDMALLESGAPYGPGLDGFGVAPERLLTVTTAKAAEMLWAMEEALHCRTVGVVIGELRSATREIDLVASRRLSLAAAEHGAVALLLRTSPGAGPSAAATRWMAEAASSFPLQEKKDRLAGLGPPAFLLTLMRNRRGPTGSWMLAWSVSDVSFVPAADVESLARSPVDRSHRARAA